MSQTNSLIHLLNIVKPAAAALESRDVEYPLEDLMHKTGLDTAKLLLVLKRFWIEKDELDIVYLNLSAEQEKELYYL